MPLTDEQIKALDISRCDPTTIAQLCTRLLAAEAKVSELQGALSLWIGSDNTAASAARDDREILLARVKVLEEELLQAADSMTCKGNGPDAAHYCPNCDSNMYGPRDRARKALQEQSK
jgi:hypothetical protein